MQFNVMRQEWSGISIDYEQIFDMSEFDVAMPQQRIAVAFAPHDRVVWNELFILVQLMVY